VVISIDVVPIAFDPRWPTKVEERIGYNKSCDVCSKHYVLPSAFGQKSKSENLSGSGSGGREDWRSYEILARLCRYTLTVRTFSAHDSEEP